MMRAVKIVFASLALAACASNAPAPASPRATAIVGVTVVHPERDGADAVQRDATVVIEGERVVAVGPRASTSVPPGATRIDGAGKWLIPGLTDGHVHFF